MPAQFGGTLRPNPTIPRVVQQVDIEETPLTIEQHTCPNTGVKPVESCWAPFP